MRNTLCEFVCTAFLMFAGTSVVAQTVLSRGKNNEYIALTLGWGISLTLAVYLGFRISGSHLNPAVSLFLFTLGQLSLLRVILYSLAQTAGAFLGAVLTFIVYYDAITSFDNGVRYVTGPRATAGIFATYPAAHLSVFGGIVDQLFGTAALCFCVGMITDRRNRIPSWAQPPLIGLTLVLVGTAWGANAGFAVNPARDLGPRLFTLCAGYGWKVFSYRNYKWFWIPILIPLIGGVVGAWLYQLLIGVHVPSEIDELEDEVRRIQNDKNQVVINKTLEVSSPPQHSHTSLTLTTGHS
ncbi:Protein AQP-3 [Aphelenchoides avenae]|nr:Protein AQP-3 [Aphelenchus avenae]